MEGVMDIAIHRGLLIVLALLIVMIVLAQMATDRALYLDLVEHILTALKAISGIEYVLSHLLGRWAAANVDIAQVVFRRSLPQSV
jgi:hypothetical protein